MAKRSSIGSWCAATLTGRSLKQRPCRTCSTRSAFCWLRLKDGKTAGRLMILSHLKSRFSQAIFDRRVQAALQQHVDHGCEILRRGQMQERASDWKKSKFEIAMVRFQSLYHFLHDQNFIELDGILQHRVKVAFGNGAHGCGAVR